MKIIERLEEKINKDITASTLLKVALLLLIVFLCIQTRSFWTWLANKAWVILSPFVLGFVIAYILKTPIAFGEKHHIKRGAMVCICYIGIFVFLAWLIMSIVPMVFNRLGDFINSIIAGVNWLSIRYTEYSSNNPNNTWVLALVQQATKSLKDLSSLIPEISNMLPTLLNNAIGSLTNGLFAIIISIFMSIGWEKIRFQILLLSRRVSKMCFDCVVSINEEVSSYIHSLMILMLIKFVEYALVYLLIGHADWWILALMTSISLLIPYIGPTIVNCIGILTSLSISGGRVILLILLIVILSQVDEYVIAPLVHSHNTAVTPLWALFSIFTGNALLGITGLIIAIPSFLAIRVIVLKYQALDTCEGKS